MPLWATWQFITLLLLVPVVTYIGCMVIAEIVDRISEWRRKRNRIVVFGGER